MRVVLLGDSIFDNAAYAGPEGAAVIDHLHTLVGWRGWRTVLAACDGARATDVPRQVAEAEPSAGDLCVVSAGGNDALAYADLLDDDRCDTSYRAVFEAFHKIREHFRNAYAPTLDAACATGATVIPCTIYNGNFADSGLAARATAGVGLFNDVIAHEANRRDLRLLEMRAVCADAACFANTIEPSDTGGKRIAEAIARQLDARPLPPTTAQPP